MTDDTVFSLDLLKAVNAWQIGSTQKTMHYVAEDLLTRSARCMPLAPTPPQLHVS